MLKDQEYIQATRNLILSEREKLYRELKEIPTYKVYPAYANFILLKIQKPGLTSFNVFEACIKQGLMIRDCASFQCLEGEFIRFCIMMPEDNARLLNVLSSCNPAAFFISPYEDTFRLRSQSARICRSCLFTSRIFRTSAAREGLIVSRNRSLHSLYVPYSCLSQISLPPGALWHGFQLCNTQLPPLALQYNLSKENPPKTPFLQCMQRILTNIPSNFKLYSFILVQ